MPLTPDPYHDGEKKRHTLFFHLRLYQAAHKPVREDKGTPYPCKQQDLDGCLKHRHDNSKARYITPDKACDELCRWLNYWKDPDKSSSAALQRLKDGLKLDPWGPDLVIKAFKDLDLAFFKGTLLGNVRVKWICRTEWQEICSGKRESSKHAVAYTEMDGHAQCYIALNASAHLLDPTTPKPYREMWRTMLHEMCHAYLFVKCGEVGAEPYPGDPVNAEYDNGHGTPFRRCIHAVDIRARTKLKLSAICSTEDYGVDGHKYNRLIGI